MAGAAQLLTLVQGLVEVPDVGVHGAHLQPRRVHRRCDLPYRFRGEVVGHVVTHSGQGAQVDLGEAEAGDGGQCVVEREVPQGDR